MKEIVIPKERAVFWMDRNGCWHNRHGKFEHKKIIDYFHSAIRKDDQGYYLCQQLEDRIEKVYFPYEDTALFVVDILWQRPVTLVLNTRQRIPLVPEDLYIQGDNLYLRHGGDRIKFNETSLMKMSDRLEIDDDQYAIRIGDHRFVITQA